MGISARRGNPARSCETGCVDIGTPTQCENSQTAHCSAPFDHTDLGGRLSLSKCAADRWPVSVSTREYPTKEIEGVTDSQKAKVTGWELTIQQDEGQSP